jgi:hypothetical protein
LAASQASLDGLLVHLPDVGKAASEVVELAGKRCNEAIYPLGDGDDDSVEIDYALVQS